MGIIVLDVGTSSMRSVLYDKNGKKLFTKQVEYTPVYLKDNQVEQNPRDWQKAMQQTLSAAAVYAGQTCEEIEAVSVTAQRSSVIPIGEHDEILGNAIMWQDKRCLGILEELKPYNDRVFALCKSRLNPVFSGGKMAWIRRECPNLYEKAKRLAVIPDFLFHELTGEWKTDATYGSRSMLMNLKTRQWDDELLAIFGVDMEKLCPIVEPGSIVGYVTKEASRVYRISQGIPVITAGGDQQCAALGMGIIREGSLEISAGTGGYIIAASEHLPENLKQNVICNASAIPGQYILESSILTCASAFNWLLKLCYGMNAENKKEVLSLVNQEIRHSMEERDDLLILPHFQGRGTPDWNSGARGHILNLTLNTERGDLARAMLEGIAMEIEENIGAIAGYISGIDNVYLCGGMANSEAFVEILTSICGVPVGIYSDNEAAALGAWISAAVTLSQYPDYETAFAQARAENQVRMVCPDHEKKVWYQGKKKQYRDTYGIQERRLPETISEVD